MATGADRNRRPGRIIGFTELHCSPNALDDKGLRVRDWLERSGERFATGLVQIFCFLETRHDEYS
jgi:hypothetical protein